MSIQSQLASQFPVEQKTYSTQLKMIEGEEKCEAILPYPRDVIVPRLAKAPAKISSTLRLSNYQEKLKETKCMAIYPRVNSTMMTVANQEKKAIAPLFRVAAPNTRISFFNNVKSFSIEKQDLQNQLEQAKRLPSYFHWAEQNQNITKPFNQGLCGSCWAVAAATCLSDVFVVSKKVKSNPEISTSYILSCHPQGQCDGGDPSVVVDDLENNGVSTDTCMDYSWCTKSACGGDATRHFDERSANTMIPACRCNKPSAQYLKYFASNAQAICIPPNRNDFTERERSNIDYYLKGMYGLTGSNYADMSALPYKDIQSLIKNHIYYFGPVIGGFHVFRNFFKGRYNKTNGIYIESVSYEGVPGVDYSSPEDSWSGSHAVVIVGWGTDKIENESVDYWIVRNSWGENWGASGYFKMGMYGNEPNKKYQNRYSQFEYPSVINTDDGIALTGGVLLMHPGRIEVFKEGSLSAVVTEPPQNIPEVEKITEPTTAPVKTVTTTSQPSLLSIAVTVLFFYLLYVMYTKKGEQTGFMFIGKVLVLLFIVGYILQQDPAMSNALKKVI